MENQKLLSNKDLLLKNLKEVVDNLKDCESYIADVLVSKAVNTTYRLANRLETAKWADCLTTA